MGEDQPATWRREPLVGGGSYVNLTRLTDGRVLCQLCFDYFPLNELHAVGSGQVEDVCWPCAMEDAQQVHEKRQRDDPTHDRCSCVCCCATCDPDYA